MLSRGTVAAVCDRRKTGAHRTTRQSPGLSELNIQGETTVLVADPTECDARGNLVFELDDLPLSGSSIGGESYKLVARQVLLVRYRGCGILVAPCGQPV